MKIKLEELKLQKVPVHVAIIMDGNGRWAKKRGMPRAFGHREGVKTVRKILAASRKLGVQYLTVYAFSTENWKRPQDEVNGLMQLFGDYLKNERKDLDKTNTKILFSGRREGISEKLLKEMDSIKEFLSKNTGITLNIAFNYGGRAEIVDAVNRLIKEGNAVTEEEICKYMYNPEVPDPELVIRTSGEMRISNFLIWEAAYSEYYVTEKLWPDFNEKDLLEALEHYEKRERRFGGIKDGK